MLIDTDVLIWYLKGNTAARKVIEGEESFTISAVTYIELVQGMRNKAELNALRQALKVWGAKIIYINEEISSKAVFYVEQLYLSHSVQLADALIAATAASYGHTLLTGNDKRYRPIKEISMKKFRPNNEQSKK